MFRWPFVNRSTFDRVAADRDKAAAKVKDQQRALAKLGHARDQAYKDAAKVVEDLRVLAFRIDRDPEGTRLRFSFEIADEVIFDSMRRSTDFRLILGHMLEEAMYRSPEGRAALRGRGFAAMREP